jgi:membrane protein
MVSMRTPRRDDLLTFGAAALLTGLVIFAAEREAQLAQEGADRRRREEEKKLAAFRARDPADEPVPVQHARAAQPGRGRDAQSPFNIPWRGWKDILWRTWAGISEDHLLTLAGGVAFFALLAMVPALTAAVSSYALFADARAIEHQLSLLSDMVPPAALEIIRGEIVRIVAGSDGKLTVGFIGGLALSLWSANAGVKALFEALNVTYAEDEKRSLVELNVFSLLTTACAIAAGLLVIASVVVLPLVLATVGLPGAWVKAIAYIRWPAMLVLAVLAFAFLYQRGPSRAPAKPHWITPGSALAAFAWLATSALFSWYLGNFANYNATYGALGAIAGLMMWMWLSAVVLLVGAKLNAEIEHQTAVDSTTGAPQPIGHRGATMADTVGRAVD